MDLRVSWRPTLNGQTLPDCERVSDLIFNEVSPSIDDPLQKAWTRAYHADYFSRYPDFQNALWEAVRAIWQLKQVDPGEVNDPVWENHIEAWLVSRSHLGASGRC